MLDRLRQIACKVEGTEGTMETLALADAVQVYESGFNPVVDPVANRYLGADRSKTKTLRGKRQGTITCQLPIKGSGTAGTAPEYGTLIQGCGFSETEDPGVDTTYALISTGDSSFTLGYYRDGKLNRIGGARGNMKMIFEVGMPGLMEFSFLGGSWDDADGSLLVPSYDTTVPPLCLGITFTIDSYAFKPHRLELDLGNALTLREDISKASGYLSALLGVRNPVGRIDPEDILVATYDVAGKMLSASEGALSIVLGGTAGNICTITAPKVAYTSIAPTARGEIATLDVGLELNKNSGNDELLIVYT
jgi:hypothetical protein